MRSLIWQDPTCQGATKPVCHNCWACALEPGSSKYWAHVLQLQKPTCPSVRAVRQEQLPQWEACVPPQESSPHSPQLEKSLRSNNDPAQPKMRWKKKEQLLPLKKSLNLFHLAFWGISLTLILFFFTRSYNCWPMKHVPLRGCTYYWASVKFDVSL